MLIVKRRGENSSDRELVQKMVGRRLFSRIFDGRRQAALLHEPGEKDHKEAVVAKEQLGEELYMAARKGDVAAVDVLIQGGADVNWQNAELRRTPLSRASWIGHAEVVEWLLQAGADVNLADKCGETPLHRASSRDHAKVVGRLLRAGADIHLLNKDGWSAVQAACLGRSHNVLRVLLPRSGSLLYTADKDGYLPLHVALLEVWRDGCSDKALKTFQVLIAHGMEWDSTCEKIANQDIEWPSSLGVKPNTKSNGQWRICAPAIRLCFERWMQEHEHGLPLTDVPVEEVRAGIDATKTYLREIAASKDVKIRCKICVVGPGSWGKTSLIKSLTQEQPSLVHIDNRTIGIDLFKLKFNQTLKGVKVIKQHEVTFWDFAGQDAYQVAHSLFFSARTLYIVCIDLEAFVTACMQAQLMTDTESEFDHWVNDFIEMKVLKWIRVICARQPDAQFVYVATKKDRVGAADLEDTSGALAILKSILENVEVIVQEMKRALDTRVRMRDEPSGVKELAALEPISYLGDPRLAHMAKKPSVRMVMTSCITTNDVNAFKTWIQDAIVESDRGYPMPDKYTHALETLLKVRAAATALTTDERLFKTLVTVDSLVDTLVKTMNDDQDRSDTPVKKSSGTSEPEQPYLDESTCRTILQTLHDLGDILWYDHVDDELLRNTIILDPILMIDLVRQVFDHKRTAETMTHDTLKGLELWKHLEGTDAMLSMKRVLQHFQLVYPMSSEMKADSDLIVPAYWQSNTCAFWMFGGGDLRFGRGIHREDVAVRVHWEFQFVNNYPHTLFDHVVVASYSPFHPRDVGPDWIMYMEKDKCACRLVLKRALHTHRWILHVEVLQGHTATEDHVEHVWDCFLLVVTTLEKVIGEYPGVVVSRSAQEDKEGDTEKTRYKFETLRQRSMLSVPSRKWMPPQKTWEDYLAYMKQ